MADCIFCKIVNKEILSDIIYEDKDSLAFLDISPINKGHTLVMSKKHYKNLLETNKEDLEKMIIVIKKVGNAIIEATNAEGMNIIANINPIAGQIIFHTHVHLIPRFKNDGYITIVKYKKKYEEGESQKLAVKIKSLLK